VSAPYTPAWVPTLFDLPELLAVLDVEPGAPVASVPSGHGGVLGAQLLGQQVRLAERLVPGKRVQSLQTLFVRTGRADRPMTVDVEHLQSGRSFASLTLTFRQDDVLVSRASALLTVDEPDFLRRVATAPPVPAGALPVSRALLPWEARAVPTADPAELDLLLRVTAAADDPSLWRALVAFTSEVPAVQQVVEGMGVAVPDARLPGAVLAQTLTFLEPLDVRDWHRVRVVVPHVGHGRLLARGEVFDAQGQLAVTFATSGLLRAPAGGRAGLPHA
jgi:acyl-CoA thioesterase II